MEKTNNRTNDNWIFLKGLVSGSHKILKYYYVFGLILMNRHTNYISSNPCMSVNVQKRGAACVSQAEIERIY